MKKNLVYSIVVLATAGVSACNSGHTTAQNSLSTQGNKITAEKPAVKSITPHNSDYPFHGIAVSDSIQSNIMAPQSNYIMVPNLKGVIIGRRDALSSSSASYSWGGNLNLPSQLSVHDAAFCPAIDGRVFGVVVGDDQLGVVSSSNQPSNNNPGANTFSLNYISTYAQASIVWSSVSCTQSKNDVYIALAGYDVEDNLWGATYAIPETAIKDKKTLITSNELYTLISPRRLATKPDGFNKEYEGDHFFNASFVKYKFNSKTDVGIVYSTAYGLYYTPQLGTGIIALNDITSLVRRNMGDNLLSVAPTASLLSSDEDVTPGEEEQVPMIALDAMDISKSVNSFIFFGEAFTSMNNRTPFIQNQYSTVVQDPLGSDVLNGHTLDPLVPVISGNACTEKNHLCLFLLRNLNSKHTASVLVGYSSLKSTFKHTKDTVASYIDINQAGSYHADSVYTGIAALNDGQLSSKSQFIMVGGQYGNIVERSCSSATDCSQVVLKDNLENRYTGLAK